MAFNAERHGIDSKTIENILHPAAGKPGGTNSLQSELKAALGSPITLLATAINKLVEKLNSASTSTGRNLGPTQGVADASNTTSFIPSHTGNYSGRYGTAEKVRPATVDLGGIHVTVQAGNKAELTSKINKNCKN